MYEYKICIHTSKKPKKTEEKKKGKTNLNRKKNSQPSRNGKHRKRKKNGKVGLPRGASATPSPRATRSTIHPYISSVFSASARVDRRDYKLA